ncbi:hypothetical protein QQ045_006315 [Rhodiola kirilowii]
MQAMWASMSEYVKCVCKNSVEVLNPGDKVKYCRRRPSHDACTGRISEHRPRRNSEHREASTTFVQLSKGDTSRNIVEMIYQAAVRDLKSERSMPVISQVFKVQNSIAISKRFEEHRDAVKKKECEKKGNRHSRVLVDGNELLQFYSTTISCNCSETSQRAGLCKEFVCGVCKTIQTGFEMECKEKKGILLSASSEALTMEKRNERRAVIVCRTIAGVMGYMNEKNEGCDSVRSVKGSKLDYLIVRNPRAVLPCFVIVFE